MRVRRPPTHVLRVEIPLHLDPPPSDYDPVKHALDVALSVSQAAFDGHVCDDIQVTMLDGTATS
jgi:hypothetical protein